MFSSKSKYYICIFIIFYKSMHSVECHFFQSPLYASSPVVGVIDSLAKNYFGSRTIFFFCDSPLCFEEIKKFTKELSSLGLFSTCLSDHGLLRAAKRMEAFPHHLKPIVVILNLSAKSHELLLGHQQLTLQIDMAQFHWMYFADLDVISFQNFSLPYNCRFLLLSSNLNVPIIMELYKVAGISPIRTIYLNYSNLSPATLTTERMNFNGHLVQFHSHKEDPCEHLTVAEGLVIPCIHFKIWKLIVETLNATTDGVYFERNSPVYLAQGFNQGKASVSIDTVYMTSFSLHHVDFFWPTIHTKLEVYTKFGDDEISWNRYLKPFSDVIWFTVVGWTILCCIIVEIARKMALKYLSPQINFCARFHQIWSPIFAFVGQGTTEPAEKIWERLLLLSAFLAPAVLIPAYNAALTSFLTTQSHEMPFTRLEEMRNFPKYRLTGIQSFRLDEVFQKGVDETSTYLLNYAMLSPDERPTTSVEGFRRMCSERLSFIETQYSAAALKPPCKYYKLLKPFAVYPLSMTMAKKLPYSNVFNIVMRNIRFSGILQTIKYSITKSEIMDLFLENNAKPVLPQVGIENIVLLLTALLISVVLAILLLFMEILFKKKIFYTQLAYPFLP